MNARSSWVTGLCALALCACSGLPTDRADRFSQELGVDDPNADPATDRMPGVQNVQHVVVLMQENHSFDNYFGALPYAAGSPYHSPHRGYDGARGQTGCHEQDHQCVDGLTCVRRSSGALSCLNSNLDDDGTVVHAFHDTRRCVVPDLDHSWVGTHQEANYNQPNARPWDVLNNGFVRVNDVTEQLDNGTESPTDDQTMAFYNEDEIPFYYDLAGTFAISDRYFSSLLGPTFPNRSYLMAATSFGHLTTSDLYPPPGGYKPVNGTIFDLLEAAGVTWADYFQDAPQGADFRAFGTSGVDPHFAPVPVFLAQASGASGAGDLPAVSFVDPNFGLAGVAGETDEHPPTDIQRGQAFISQVINAVRSGPYWSSTVILMTYDEHGGFYDHVQPPLARQGGQRTPDGIYPGQCADLSNPPSSQQPGAGAECATNLLSQTDTTVVDAIALCPDLAQNPTGTYPEHCAAFDQLGIRVPFLAISPFAKPHYVSHEAGDHTSILAFIERVFLQPSDGGTRAHLTLRDADAYALGDLFDFENSPSLDAQVGQAAPPTDDCTPTQ